MDLKANFVADFSKFKDAVDKADIQLKTFAEGASTAGARLKTMADSLNGTKIIQQATLAVAAIDKVGGVSTLTDKQLKSLAVTVAEASEKMVKLGQEVPPSFTAVTDAAGKLKDEVSKAADATGKTQTFFGSLKDEVAKTALGFISAQAVIGAATTAFHALTAFVSDSVKAFSEAEAAQSGLTAALRQSGQATPAVIGQYNELASQFQRTTVFSDDMITSTESLLVQVGGVMPSQMRAALKATTDLSAGLGIDLRSATLLVAKAFASGGEDLGRLKGVLGDAVQPGADMAQVMEAINSKFGGQASAQITTYAGQITQAENAWNNFQEAVGKVVVNSSGLQAAVNTVNASLSDDADMAAAAAKEQGKLAAIIHDVLGGHLIQAAHDIDTYNAALEADIFIVREASRLQEELNDKLAKGAATMPSLKTATDQLMKSDEGIASWIAVLSTDTDTLNSHQKDQIVTLSQLGASANDLADRFNVSASAISHVVDAHRKAEDAAQSHKKTLDDMAASLTQLQVESEKALGALIGDEADARRFADALKEVDTQAAEGAKNMAALVAVMKTLPAAVEDLKVPTASLDSFLAGIGVHAKQIGPESVAPPKVPTSLFSGLSSAVPQALLASIAGGGNAAQAVAGTVGAGIGTNLVKEFGTKITDTLGKTFGGAINAVLPGLGALAGPLVGFIGKVFGPSEESSKVSPVRDEFFKMAGGLEALNPKILEATGSLALVQSVLDAKTVDQYTAAVGNVNTVLGDLAQKGVAAQQGFTDIATKMGHVTEISPDLQKALQTAYDSTNPDDFLSAVKNINGVLDDQASKQQFLDDTMKKYGLSWTELGQSAKNAHVAETSSDIGREFQALVGAGIDVNHVMEKIGPNINGFVHDAKNAGAEIPESFKSVIQTAIDAGKIYDDNGVKITDMKDLGLTFGSTMEKTMKDVVTPAIQHLADVIQNTLGPAIKNIPQPTIVGHVTWNVDTPDFSGFNGANADGSARGSLVTSAGLQYFDRGRVLSFTPRGTDTVPAMLTPGEMVLNENQQKAVSALMGRGGGSNVIALNAVRAQLAETHKVQVAIQQELEDQKLLLPKLVRDAVAQVS